MTSPAPNHSVHGKVSLFLGRCVVLSVSRSLCGSLCCSLFSVGPPPLDIGYQNLKEQDFINKLSFDVLDLSG